MNSSGGDAVCCGVGLWSSLLLRECLLQMQTLEGCDWLQEQEELTTTQGVFFNKKEEAFDKRLCILRQCPV
jgi:hypothetical protein